MDSMKTSRRIFGVLLPLYYEDSYFTDVAQLGQGSLFHCYMYA